MLKRSLPFVAFGLFVSGPASADTPYYAGITAGLTTIEVDNARVDLSAESFGFKLFAGYRYSEKVAFEFAYSYLGSFDETSGGVEYEYEPSGFSGHWVYNKPINDKTKVFGKIGLIYYETDFSVVDGTTRTSGEDDRTNAALGIGAEHKRNDRVSFRAELDWLDLDTVDRSLFLSFGFSYGFGGEGQQ